MTAAKDDSEILFGIYKLHTELAEQASATREGLNKLYSGMVASIIAASVLLHHVTPDSADVVWVLPVLGIVVSLSWMASLHSVTGRLSAKHAVLLEMESMFPFDFLKREIIEFEKRGIVRRQRSEVVIPIAFLVICVAWLTTLPVKDFC